jgi:aspartate aminotransferase-like enzyme
VHSETSTGVVADVQALARVAQETGTLTIVDAVSSLGAVPLETDAWGLDVVVAGSQKALMTPPGLSLAAVSAPAWERASRSSTPRYYFDWERMRSSLATGSTPFTPAVTLVASLDVALGLLLEEGLDSAFARHAALGRACREGSKAMGLELFSPDEERSAVVTAIITPEGVDAKELVLELRDRFGITVAGAHGELGTRMFRIGHIGYYDVLDITTALTAVETLLVERGAPIEPGVAVARALEAYHGAARVG